MRARVYLKIAKNGYKYKVKATTKSDSTPLKLEGGYNKEDTFLPTVGFGVDFVIPDELFDAAQQIIAEIDVSTKGAKVLAEVPLAEVEQTKKVLPAKKKTKNG